MQWDLLEVACRSMGIWGVVLSSRAPLSLLQPMRSLVASRMAFLPMHKAWANMSTTVADQADTCSCLVDEQNTSLDELTLHYYTLKNEVRSSETPLEKDAYQKSFAHIEKWLTIVGSTLYEPKKQALLNEFLINKITKPKGKTSKPYLLSPIATLAEYKQ